VVVLELSVSECLCPGALHQLSGAGERCCHWGLGFVAAGGSGGGGGTNALAAVLGSLSSGKRHICIAVCLTLGGSDQRARLVHQVGF
jgi:hypothetical protein